MTKAIHSKFVLCLRSGDSEDLELRKLYQCLPDAKAIKEGYLRIIDESGEDYLYPADYFAAIKLPASITRQLVPLNSAIRETAPSR